LLTWYQKNIIFAAGKGSSSSNQVCCSYLLYTAFRHEFFLYDDIVVDTDVVNHDLETHPFSCSYLEVGTHNSYMHVYFPVSSVIPIVLLVLLHYGLEQAENSPVGHQQQHLTVGPTGMRCWHSRQA